LPVFIIGACLCFSINAICLQKSATTKFGACLGPTCGNALTRTK